MDWRAFEGGLRGEKLENSPLNYNTAFSDF